MQKTTNYQLNQWEAADGIERAAFNADNAAIDAALSAHDTAITDTNTQLAAVAAALGTGGENCRIAWGSYTGTGTYGPGTSTAISVDFFPVAVIVGTLASIGGNEVWPTIMLRGLSKALCDNSTQKMELTWTDRGVSWYGNAHAAYQNNVEGYIYQYIVIGYSDAA